MTNYTPPDLPPGLMDVRAVPGFPKYVVGHDGKESSIWSRRTNGRWAKRVLTTCKRGYQGITLCRNGGSYQRNVHRIVCEAFHGPKLEGYEVCHGDGVRNNNLPCNLRWDTRKNNFADRDAHGKTIRGEKHHRAKLANGDIQEIHRLRNEGWTHKALAERFGVVQGTIGFVLRNKTWKHLSA